MPNLSDIPEELLDLTKLADVKEFIAGLPISYESRMSLFTTWSEEVNHPLSGADFVPFEDPEDLPNGQVSPLPKIDPDHPYTSSSSANNVSE